MRLAVKPRNRSETMASGDGRAWSVGTPSVDAQQVLDSLHRSQAVIQFEPNGVIVEANENFLSTVGYRLDEIVGQHHRMFVDPDEAESRAYSAFWEELRAGTFQSAEFRRIGKGGNEIWIQASYNPVLDDKGRVVKVVKFASDVTVQKQAQREVQDRTQAVIEFEPDGTIITANQLFLDTVGYRIDQVRGQHHRMFLTSTDAADPAYQQFWPSLARGEFRQGEFHRVNSRGEEVWLRGAYSPVFGADGTVHRVIKGVADITPEVRGRAEASRVGGAIARNVTEMSGAIQEISQTIARTASLAQTAESGVQQASSKVKALEEASETIGSVINVISGLSGQTNLLALNATIEAARAGEAGSGFAVVATEVKHLAKQTAEAAADIHRSIESIQVEIAEAVASIGEISASVTDVSDMTTTVAAAVEEQSALMGEMDTAATELLALNATDR